MPIIDRVGTGDRLSESEQAQDYAINLKIN